MSGLIDPIPRGFDRQIVLRVLSLFFLTMAVFLWTAYRSERGLHYRMTSEQLRETLAVLSRLPAVTEAAAGPDLADLEQELTATTSAAHRVLVADAAFTIVASSSKDAVGADVWSYLDLPQESELGSAVEARSTKDGGWLASWTPLGETGAYLFLLHSDTGGPEFAERFWTFYGLYVGTTSLLFFLMLRFFAERFVRHPIELLAAHVQRVETGEFDTRPEKYRADEFGWLADRFTAMGLRQKEALQHKVRGEKAATAAAVAYRVARESAQPLEALKRHIIYLEGVAGEDADLQKLADSLKADFHTLAGTVSRLQDLGPPLPDSSP